MLRRTRLRATKQRQQQTCGRRARFVAGLQLRVPRARTSNSFGGAPSSVGTDFGGGTVAESEVGDDYADDDAESADDDVEKNVRRRISSLSCTQALDGKKLGNQKRRANELLEKLQKKQARTPCTSER